MSNLPLRFLASWQAKQFSLRTGATSLMKLTGPLGAAGAWAAARRGANSTSSARAAQRMQTQKRWDRSMVGQDSWDRDDTPVVVGKNSRLFRPRRDRHDGGR